jgi:GT2 family glycosyltransferase
LPTRPSTPVPAVSIVIPTYDRAYCLGETIASLQRQTYVDWEAVIVDDGSKDDTEAKVAGIAAIDERIRYHKQANAGVSAARNRGISLARGQWIAFLDSDDSWEPWKIEAQLACFRANPDVGMVWTDMDAVDAQGQLVSPRHLRKMYSAYGRVGRRQIFSATKRLVDIDSGIANSDPVLEDAVVRFGEIYTPMLFGSLVHTSTVMLTRARLSAVGGFNTRFRTGEDYDFHLRTCREGPAALLDCPAVKYRIAGGEDQLTSPAHLTEIAVNGLNIRLAALERDPGLSHLSKSELADILAYANGWVATVMFERGEYRASRPYFRASLGHRPFQPTLLAKAALASLPPAAATTMRGLIRARHANSRRE